MHCDQANELLVELASDELDVALRNEVQTHLDGCETCQQEYAGIVQWAKLANNWQEEMPPTWRAPQMAGQSFADTFRQWFPSFASAAALAMVGLIYFQPPAPSGVLPQGQPAGAAQYQDLPVLPQATQAAMVESVMEGSRAQRKEELQALLKILKAEMDRRSIETEESLRYIISHQIQGQQELDDLYTQVEAMMGESTDLQRAEQSPDQGMTQ